MSDENIIACPACEYERNSQGQPVERNGQMQCLDCGSTWRVFGTAITATSETIELTEKKTRARRLADQVSFNQTEPSPSAYSDIHINLVSYKFGLGTLMSCFAALLLFAGVFIGINFLGQGGQKQPLDALKIAEVQIEEQVRRNGEKVFTVKGLVSNPTKISKTIPSIAIILRKQNGSEITRWYYNSSLASLRAGGKSRFASSIQYDTPIVAYAEAVFK